MKKKILFVGILALVLVFKFNTLDNPYNWDAMGGIIDPALDSYDNDFRLINDNNTGHPPLHRIILVLVWKIFGYSIAISHLLIILIGAIGLFYTYRLGNVIFNRWVGVGATVLLLFNQIFFAQIGTLNYAVPLMTLSVMTLYYYLTKKPTLFVIFGSCLLLTKETALIIIVAIFVHHYIEILIKDKTIRFDHIRSGIIILLPVIPLLLWLMFLKTNLGWFYNPHLDSFFANSGLIKNLFYQFVYDNSTHNVNKYNYLILISIILYLSAFWTKIKFNIKSVYLLFFIIIIGQTALFSYTVSLPRYYLLIYPFFYIAGANAIYNIFHKINKSNIIYLFVIIACCGLFVTNYWGTRSDGGSILESNLEYLDLVETHKSAAEYLQVNFPNYTVISCWPMTAELDEPRYGYVSKKIEYSNVYETVNNEPVVYWIPESAKGTIVYYSPESSCPHLINNVDEDLVLEKRFGKNNKYTEIYSVRTY